MPLDILRPHGEHTAFAHSLLDLRNDINAAMEAAKSRFRLRLAHTSWFEAHHPLAPSRGSQLIERSSPSSATVSKAWTVTVTTYACHNITILSYTETEKQMQNKEQSPRLQFLPKAASAGPARPATVPIHPRTHLYSDAQWIVSTEKWLWRARPYTYAVVEEAGLVRVVSARSSGI